MAFVTPRRVCRRTGRTARPGRRRAWSVPSSQPESVKRVTTATASLALNRSAPRRTAASRIVSSVVSWPEWRIAAGRVAVGGATVCQPQMRPGGCRCSFRAWSGGRFQGSAVSSSRSDGPRLRDSSNRRVRLTLLPPALTTEYSSSPGNCCTPNLPMCSPRRAAFGLPGRRPGTAHLTIPSPRRTRPIRRRLPPPALG